MLKTLIASSLVLGFGLQAHADSDWVNRHNACRESLDKALKPGRYIVGGTVPFGQSPWDENARKQFGNLNAFVGTEGDQAGVWINGNGKAYFFNLPPATEVAKIGAGFPSTTVWRMQVHFPDGRPALQVELQSEAMSRGFTSLEVHGVDPQMKKSDPFYRYAVPVNARASVGREAERQSADSILQLLENCQNAEALHAPTPEIKAALEGCVAALDPEDDEDHRIANSIRILSLPRAEEGVRQIRFDEDSASSR